MGGGVHHRTISPICESGSGKPLLQSMAARAGRRSRIRRILVGETTDENSLLLMIRMSKRQKLEVRNQRGFGGVLGTFSPRKKYPVGDRHTVATRLCSTAALRHGQSLRRGFAAPAFGPGRNHRLLPALATNSPQGCLLNASRPLHKGAFWVRYQQTPIYQSSAD